MGATSAKTSYPLEQAGIRFDARKLLYFGIDEHCLLKMIQVFEYELSKLIV